MQHTKTFYMHTSPHNRMAAYIVSPSIYLSSAVLLCRLQKNSTMSKSSFKNIKKYKSHWMSGFLVLSVSDQAVPHPLLDIKDERGVVCLGRVTQHQWKSEKRGVQKTFFIYLNAHTAHQWMLRSVYHKSMSFKILGFTGPSKATNCLTKTSFPELFLLLP